jgi:hypothetical protein
VAKHISSLATLLFTMLLTAAGAPRAKAFDAALELAELHLPTLAVSPAYAAKSLLRSADNVGSSVSLGLGSLPSYGAAQGAVDADANKVRRKLARAGYGLAAGLGLVLAGITVAAQTRPHNWEFSSGICYDSQASEKTYLYVASGVMAVGLVVSSAMLVRLIGLRRAHPDVRPTRRMRGFEALVGIAAAASATAVLMGSTASCASS